MGKPNLLLDFDHTIHAPNPGFTAHLGPPLSKARHACLLLSKHFRLICFTPRPPDMVEKWLRANGFPHMLVTDRKQTGIILDNNAVTFPGEWTDELISFLKNFQSWHAGKEGEISSPFPNKTEEVESVQDHETADPNLDDPL